MVEPDPSAARRFAVEVVTKLRAAGYEALWAGGCVRDRLLGREPEDYDVATSARPDEIRRVFGRRRTLAIGAAFGVITVLGKKETGTIQVATFRRDAPYSDGRHPDSVTFSSAEEDARRRDFTINGLFYDPIAEQVIDFVGGQQDLREKVIRAIGDPYQRIAEDKLRMLRAVRFAATFGFVLEEATRRAVQQQATEIAVVSAERIAAELRRMLVHPSRVTGVQLLHETRLLKVILPECDALEPPMEGVAVASTNHPWGRTLGILAELEEPTFPIALAALLRDIYQTADSRDTDSGRNVVERMCRRWKLSNEEMLGTQWLLEHENQLRVASQIPWPVLQRLLISDRIGALLKFAEAVAVVLDGQTREIDYCRTRLALPADQLNPPALIDGNDLKTAGIPPGPVFQRLLEETRDAQLEGRITDRQAALDFANSLWRSMGQSNGGTG